jgi:hypothetical protein
LDPATIEGAVAIASAIVNVIVKNAPAIIDDWNKSAPYINAIAGMIQGTNATQESIDSLLASANIAADEFLKPLPPDDGTTTG